MSKYDVIICHTPLASHLVRFFSWGFGSRILYFVHGFRFQIERGSFLDRVNISIEKILRSQTAHYFVINADDHDFVVNELGAPVSLIHGGVGFDPSRLNRGKRLYRPVDVGGSLRILVVSAFKIGKGYLEILNVAEMLGARPFSIDCFGYGDSRWIQRQIFDRQISNVTVHEFEPDIGNRLHEFDVLLCLSEREGLPVSIMEAMASGMVVLASDIRGCRDLIVDGVDGYLVNRKDCSNIIGLLETLRVNNELRSKVGKQAAEKAHTLWRGDLVAKVFRERVETIVQRCI